MRSLRCLVGGTALALVALLLLGACTRSDNSQAPDPVRDDDGQVLDPTAVDALRVQVGDCFNGTIPFAVGSIDALPCAEPHDHEVYAVFDLDPTPDPVPPSVPEGASTSSTSASSTSTTADLADEEYPGEARVQELGERGCLVAFGSYVGSAYETSALEIGLILPTEETWDAIGDREVVCTVRRADGAQLTGSVQGTGL